MAATVWFYNENTGLIRSEADAWYNKPGDYGLKEFGWHGPFNSEQAARDYYTTNKPTHPKWVAPTTSIPKAVVNSTGTTVNDTKQLFGLSDAQISTWFLRIGEVVLGLVLIAVGVAKLTGTSNVVSSAIKAKI